MGTESSLEFAKGDIKKSSINGIPSIVFSNRINQMLIKDMALMVVIKLLGWNIGYFPVKFHSKDDYDKVLSQGHWIVFGHLPGHLYNRKILSEIGELKGKVVRLDFNTDSTARGRFARIVIFINLDKPLVSQILINGVIQRIEYESSPIVCFACDKYGHGKDLCPSTKSGLVEEGGQVVVTGNGKDAAVLEEAGGKTESANFGPWMIVEKKSRSNLRDIRGSGDGIKAKDHFSGSRYSIMTAANQYDCGLEGILKAFLFK
ncbi:hypothetical protein J1N35_002205 [Gossypium stocksii]|uniref:DUF4283 domain-containing protein n=1 Tax=Gossypium stocksii TaxID=47602 RepID=A0A9D3WJ72_9ROSI|nr:hypothetical protein J1N35_002205 [Gossypium stocksii]